MYIYIYIYAHTYINTNTRIHRHTNPKRAYIDTHTFDLQVQKLDKFLGI